jgi:hypothetical protein
MKRDLLALVVGALLTATAAFADTTDNLPPILTAPQPTGASCASLQRQFDAEIVTHANKPRAASAREKRRKGEQACNNGRYDDGVKDLVKALRYINVQPAMQ